MRLIRIVLAVLAAALGVVVVAAPANALSCKEPEAVAEQAPAIVTGRILDAEDHRILVSIRERWKGDLDVSPIWFELDPTLDGWWDPIPGGSFPDRYTSKGIWLFMPTAELGKLQVSPCSAWPMTGPWKVNYPRPEKVARPVEKAARPEAVLMSTDVAKAEDDNQEWFIGGSIAVALVAAGAGYVLVRRRLKKPQSAG